MDMCYTTLRRQMRYYYITERLNTIPAYGLNRTKEIRPERERESPITRAYGLAGFDESTTT